MSQLFVRYNHAHLTGLSLDLRAVTLRWQIVDKDAYTPSVAADEFLSDIPSPARVTSSAPLTKVTVTSTVLDADNAH